MDEGKNNVRDIYYHQYQKHGTLDRGTMVVPRSSDPVESHLRQAFEHYMLQGAPLLTNLSIPRSIYSFPNSNSPRTKVKDILVSSMEDLVLDDDEYTLSGNSYTTTRESFHSKAEIRIINSMESKTSKENRNIRQCDAIKGAKQGVQSQIVDVFENSDSSKPSLEIHQVIKGKHNNSYCMRVLRSAINPEPLNPARLDKLTHNVLSTNESTKHLSVVRTQKSHNHDTTISSHSQISSPNGINLRGIGSWLPSKVATPFACGTIVQETFHHPDITDFYRDAVQESGKTITQTIRQCAGNAPARQSGAYEQPNQPTERRTPLRRAFSSHSRGKRRHRDDDDDDDDDEEHRDEVGLGPLETIASKQNHNLACPFFKHHSQSLRAHGPYKYRTCATTSLADITRLKEHLYRKHKQPITCPRCQEVFKTMSLRDSHLREDRQCLRQPKDTMIFMSPDAEAELKKRTAVPDQLEKWREIFSLLFPGASVPSPTHEVQRGVDESISRNDASFVNELRSQMPVLLYPEIYSTLERRCQNEAWISTLIDELFTKFRHYHTQVWQAHQEQQQRITDGQDLEFHPPSNTGDITREDTFRSPYTVPDLVSNITTPFVVDNTGTNWSSSGTRLQFPQTPCTVASIAPNFCEPESIRSDSGYASCCDNFPCNDSSCIFCLNLMQSPTMQKSEISGSSMLFTPTTSMTTSSSGQPRPSSSTAPPFGRLQNTSEPEQNDDEEYAYQF